MKREQNFQPSSEEKTQRLRESRYKRSIEREKNLETRETINIFETPLFFRKDPSLLAYLEYERIGGIRASGTTFSRINDPRELRPTEKSIFLESPIPYWQKDLYISDKVLKKILDNTSDKNCKHDSIVWKVVEAFHGEFPEIDEEVLIKVIEKSTRLAHKGGQRVKDNMKTTYAEMEERQNFIKDLLQNPEYRNVWLSAQKVALKKHPLKSFLHTADLGLRSQFFNERGSTFLVSPESTDIFSIEASQHHHDFMLEIIAVKDIPKKQILGYLEYQDEDANVKLEKIISAEAPAIYGHGPSRDSSHIYFIRNNLNKLIEEVSTGYWNNTLSGSRRKLSESEVEKRKKELCTILSIPESSFSAEMAKEKLETMPGIYNKFYERGIRSFPDIPSEELTLKEIEQQIFERMLPRLKDLFPFQNFRIETVEQDVATALTKYITDRFEIDPREITMKDFVHLVVKSMGIPIYDLQGNQIWPLQKTYEEIHQLTQKE